MTILISGSMAYDRIMSFPGKFEDHILPDKIHILNVCFTVDSLIENFGGTAGNIAYSLALLDERPVILSAGGKDFEPYEKWLVQHGLPLDGIRRIPEELTAGAYIITDTTDNQITCFNSGAMKHQSRYSIAGFNPSQTVAIIAPGNPDDMLFYCRAYKQMGIPYIFDPGQQIPILPVDLIIEVITDSDILISNDYELEMIMNATGLTKQQILERTRTIVTTFGENGSAIITRDGKVDIRTAKADQVTDPTGAGDAYRSGLLKGLAIGKDLKIAAEMGATCASFAVETAGTQEHQFDLDRFWARFGKNFSSI